MISTIVLRNRKSQRGATLVEYAFVLIFFLTLIFGISGFGHFLYVYHAINNAAKEGTRWASVNGSTCNDDGSCNGANGMNTGPALEPDIIAHTKAYLPPSVPVSQTYVNATFGVQSGSPDVCTIAVTGTTGPVPATKNYPGCTVNVTVSFPYNFSFPLLPSVTTTTSPCVAPGWCITTTSQQVISH